jgi:hypothetical protein
MVSETRLHTHGIAERTLSAPQGAGGVHLLCYSIPSDAFRHTLFYAKGNISLLSVGVIRGFYNLLVKREL